jgi:hypothetical protein
MFSVVFTPSIHEVFFYKVFKLFIQKVESSIAMEASRSTEAAIPRNSNAGAPRINAAHDVMTESFLPIDSPQPLIKTHVTHMYPCAANQLPFAPTSILLAPASACRPSSSTSLAAFAAADKTGRATGTTVAAMLPRYALLLAWVLWCSNQV